MRRLIFLPMLLLLSSCAGLIAPPYDGTVETQAIAAYGLAARIAAEVQLGQFASPTSYPAAADQYVSLISDIAIAKERAATLPAASALGKDAQTRLVGILQACADRAQTIAKLHQKVGLAPDAGIEGDLMTSCDQAARAAAAMK